MLQKSTYSSIGRIKKATVYSTTQINQPVKLRLSANDQISPISIPEFFYQTVEKYGNHPALIVHEDQYGNSQTVTYKEYHEKVIHLAKVFIKIGLQPRLSVAVLAPNCPEWCYSELAAIHANSVIVGVYLTSSTEVIHYILENSQANIVIVDDSKQMEQIRQLRSSLPYLKAAIQINGPFDDYVQIEEGYYKWADIILMDANDCENELNTRLNDIGINECAAVIYTSGTVGMPKGVMLTHDNIIVMTKGNVERLTQLQVGCERIVSYLPMSHIAAQSIDIFMAIDLAATVYFADNNALKGSLIKTLQKAKPTYFFGVPRIFEKFQDRIILFEKELNVIKKAIMSWARNVMLQHHLSALQGNNSDTLQYKIASNFIGRNIKSILGLDQTKHVIVGAAPTTPKMKKFFMGLDIILDEIYGCSETSGINCYASQGAKDLIALGRPLNGTDIKILNPTNDGQGEICFRGRCTYMGYLGDEEKTKDVLRDDGWLQTGDIGCLDDEGVVYVTGRIKEIIITSGGENIPAIHVENLVKEELPILSNAFLVGDRQKYLTMLVTLKTNMDSGTGKPLDSLQEHIIENLKRLGLNYKSVSEIIAAGPCPKVMAHIQNGIDRANLKAISKAQRIQKFAILPHDFSIATGELGLTLKVRRHAVCSIYKDIINRLYEL